MSTDMERELEKTTALRGLRYCLHDFVAQLSGPEALKKPKTILKQTTSKKGLIDRKAKELHIVVGLCRQR